MSMGRDFLGGKSYAVSTAWKSLLDAIEPASARRFFPVRDRIDAWSLRICRVESIVAIGPQLVLQLLELAALEPVDLRAQPDECSPVSRASRVFADVGETR